MTWLKDKYGIGKKQAIERVEKAFRDIGADKLSDNDDYFLVNIQLAVEKIVIDGIRERQKKIPGLIVEGHGFKARWGGELTPGCKSCLDGTGLTAIRSVSKCNLNCPFCYHFGKPERDELLDEHFIWGGGNPLGLDAIKAIIDKQGKGLTGVTYVFYEPFMNIEKHYELIRYISDKGINQHMYTNGTLCTEEHFRKLKEAGLDEIRFNLAATDCSKRVIENMGKARNYFEYLVIESPMYKEYYDSFMKNRKAILATGVDHINCAELHLNERNFRNFNEPVYWFRRGYCSPVSSRQLTYDMIEVAAKEKWKVVINDCSNALKYYRGIPTVPLRHGARFKWRMEKAVPKAWYLDSIERYGIFGK